ncbi:MAG: hypothetical protein LBL49_05500 [Clostridiales Family XIII bacterium]|jgi:hypothetical protein|nr:hypothetical protein [Clostridiales Family XIII bacterium]
MQNNTTPSNDVNNSSSSNDDLGAPADNDSAIPPQIREQLSSWMLSMYSEQRSGASLLVDKLNPDHISTIIENGAREDERDFSAFKIEKAVSSIIFIACLIFAIVILIVFRDSEYFVTIITALFSFLGGLGVGRVTVTHKTHR